MKLNDIFSIEQYDEAYKFVVANPNTTIKDLGDKQYQIVEIPAPTTEELSAQKRAERDSLLEQTDKYMLSDFPITDEERAQYKAYRQYLRDLPADWSFPNIEIKTFEEYKGE